MSTYVCHLKKVNLGAFLRIEIGSRSDLAAFKVIIVLPIRFVLDLERFQEEQLKRRGRVLFTGKASDRHLPNYKVPKLVAFMYYTKFVGRILRL